MFCNSRKNWKSLCTCTQNNGFGFATLHYGNSIYGLQEYGLWFVVMEFIMGTLQMFEEMWFLVYNFGKHYGDSVPQRQNVVFMTRTSCD